jgi:FXSXX-COOH protein
MEDSLEPSSQVQDAVVPDVRKMSMLELLLSGDPELAASVRRLIADRPRDDDAVAGWSSSLV